MKCLFAFFLLVAAFFFASCTKTDETLEIVLESSPAEAPLSVEPAVPIKKGESVTLHAGELAGHVFSHWIDTENGETLGEEAVHTFVPTASMTIRAIYKEEVSIKLKSTLEGALPFIHPEERIAAGTVVTIEAPEEEGHVFFHWLSLPDEEVLSQERIHSFEAVSNKRLRAVYVTEAVHAEISTFEGDLSCIGGIISSIEEHPAITRDMHLYGESGGEDQSIRLVNRERKGMADLSEVVFESEGDLFGLPPAFFHMVTVRTSFVSSLYLDAGFLWDMAEEQGFNPREVFALETDNLRLSPLPADIDFLVYEILSLFFSTFVADAIAPDLVENIFMEMERFAFLLDPDWLADVEGHSASIAPHGEKEVVVRLSFGEEALLEVFEAVYAEFRKLLAEEGRELPPLETIEEDERFLALMEEIASMEDFLVEFVYDPATRDALEVRADLSGILSILTEETVALHLGLHLAKGAEISDITDTADVQRIAKEALMYALAAESRLFVERILAEEDIGAGVYSLSMLESEHGIPYMIPLLDADKTTVEIKASGEVELDAVYRTNGKKVFAEPIRASNLESSVPLFPLLPKTREEMLLATESLVSENVDVFNKLLALREHVSNEGIGP